MNNTLYGQDLDVKCIYETNKYLIKNSSNNGPFVFILKKNVIPNEDYELIVGKNLKEIISNPSVIDMLKKLENENLNLLVIIENLNGKYSFRKKCYCSCNDNNNVIFLDEFDNQIIFNNEEQTIISSMIAVKRFENEFKYPILKDYINQLKDNFVMQQFKHRVKVESNSEYNIFFGSSIRIFDAKYNKIELNDYKLQQRIESVFLESK